MLGANTDPYQPVEKKLHVTRDMLEVLLADPTSADDHHQGYARTARSRSADGICRRNLVRVTVSLTTLDPELKRTLEPRAASPQARLRVISALARGARAGRRTDGADDSGGQ